MKTNVFGELLSFSGQIRYLPTDIPVKGHSNFFAE